MRNDLLNLFIIDDVQTIFFYGNARPNYQIIYQADDILYEGGIRSRTMR